MSSDFAPLPATVERVGRGVVDAGMTIHKTLGPGLLESAYEACLEYELRKRGHAVHRQMPLPVIYEDVKVDAGYRVDLMVDGCVVVEVKSVEALAPIHDAQLLTYLRLSERRLGYLLNFNVPLFRQGIRRMVL